MGIADLEARSPEAVRKLLRETRSTLEEHEKKHLLIDLVQVGDRIDEVIAGSEVLSFVSRELISVAQELDCKGVAGASPTGERLAGAMVALSDNGLSVFNPKDPAKRVVIVDGMLATGTLLLRQAHKLRANGAAYCGGAVLFASRTASESLGDGLDDLAVLFANPIPRQ